MNKKINIVITDDHLLFRKGLISLFSELSNIGKIHEASNGKELLSLLEKIQLPDVLLLDLKMPEMDGIEATDIIKRLYPKIKIIILSMEDDEQLILRLIEKGVNGYLLKNADPDELEKAIKDVTQKGYYFNEILSNLIFHNLSHYSSDKQRNTLKVELTNREIQILELICKEYTSDEIAQKYNLSRRTIEGHRKNMLAKTGTKNMAGLIIFAIKEGIISI